MSNESSKTISRRIFMRNSMAGLAGIAAMPVAANLLNTTPREKMGVALVGLGYYSTDILAPALQETSMTYLAGIVTGTPSKAEKWKSTYKIPEKNTYNYDTFDEIADNPEIQIVYVVLPNSMHKEYTIRAAKAGKHVICEKPMAMDADECREMIRACEENNVLLSIGYRLHYDPYNIEAMRLGQEKILGPVRHISCGAAFRNSSSDHWKLQRAMGGGSLMDMGVYPLQAARYVTGEEPFRVTAQGYSMRPAYQDIEEAVNFQLEFPGGAIANLSTGFHAGFNYLNVSAEKGRFELQPFSGYRGNKGRSKLGEMQFPQVNQQASQMDDMARSINEGKPVRVPGEEGLQDMIVVEAIRKSLQLKCGIEL